VIVSSLCALAATCGFCVGMFLVNWWVVKPLDRAGRDRQCPVQFSLSDLLCLFVVIQFAIGVLQWVGGWSISPFAVLAAVAWWAGVRLLSRAGICIVWQRCVFLVSSAPVLLGSGVALALTIGAILDLYGDKKDTSRDVIILFANIPLVCMVYVLGRFTRAIVASAGKK
jgi:hypothetical protein